MRTVQRYADEHKLRFPRAAKAVDGQVIVDDFLVSHDDWQHLRGTLLELEEMLSEIGMGIHKIAASDTRIITDIPEEKNRQNGGIRGTRDVGIDKPFASGQNLGPSLGIMHRLAGGLF